MTPSTFIPGRSHTLSSLRVMRVFVNPFSRSRDPQATLAVDGARSQTVQDEFAVCLPVEQVCNGAFTLARDPDGHCCPFNAGCLGSLLPEWDDTVAGGSPVAGCPPSDALEALSICE